MTREELQAEVLEYLRANLSIRTVVKSAGWGEPDYVKVTLALDGNEITSDTFDLQRVEP